MSRKETYALPNVISPSNPVIFDPDACTGCNNCVEVCQVDVFIPNPEENMPPVILHPDECWYCGCCATDCPNQASTGNDHRLRYSGSPFSRLNNRTAHIFNFFSCFDPSL